MFSPTFIEHLEFLYDRALEEKRARLGLVECVNHELLQPYPVLHEKPGKVRFILDYAKADDGVQHDLIILDLFCR